jgi:hypothetical protein
MGVRVRVRERGAGEGRGRMMYIYRQYLQQPHVLNQQLGVILA